MCAYRRCCPWVKDAHMYIDVSMFEYICVHAKGTCMFVSVCVCERERERESDRNCKKE